jgi:hypothetical protein
MGFFAVERPFGTRLGHVTFAASLAASLGSCHHEADAPRPRGSVPAACAVGGAPADDDALIAAVARCVHIPQLRLSDPRRDGIASQKPRRAQLGDDGTAVWISLRSDDDAAAPSLHGALLVWFDARRSEASWVAEPEGMGGDPTFVARVETLNGERVLVERLGGGSARACGFTPCDLPLRETEFVLLRRGTSLVSAGSYVTIDSGRHPDPHARMAQYGPEQLYRSFTSVVRFHDDRVDVHEDISWTWYDSRNLDIEIEWRAVRRATSTRVRSLRLRNDALVPVPAPEDGVPEESHPLHEAWR